MSPASATPPPNKRPRYRYHLHPRGSDAPSQTIPVLPSRSNLGPLTSVFTPPPSCSVAALQCSTCQTAWRGVQCHAPDSMYETISDNTECWPTATTAPPAGELSGFGFYSPGLTCPDGYTSACTAVSQTNANDEYSIATPAPFAGDFQFPLEAGETAVGCCPSGYECAVYPGSGWQSCRSIATSTLSVMDCGWAGSSSDRVQILPSSTISAIEVWAPLVQINWQSTDRPSSTSTSTTTTTLKESSRSSISQTSALSISTRGSQPPVFNASSTSVEDDSPSSLSPTVKAGISIAVLSAILLLLSFPLFFYIRRKRKSTTTPPHPCPQNGSSKVLSFTAFATPLGTIQDKAKAIERSRTISWLHNMERRKTEPAAPKPIHIDTDGFGRGLKVEDELESPIDGGSPFRLTSFPGQLETRMGESWEGFENEMRARKGSRS